MDGKKISIFIFFLLKDKVCGKISKCKEFFLTYSENIHEYKFIHRNNVRKENLKLLT